MKKTLFFALALALALPMVEAQYYSSLTSTRSGRISLFGGFHSDLTGETTFWGSTPVSDGYYIWHEYNEIEPTTLSHDMGGCYGIDITILNDYNENYMLGATAGIFGTKGKMHASFLPSTTGKSYATDIDVEINRIDVHIGIAGLVYVVPEKVSIDFSLSPGFLFSFGDQARYNNTPAIDGDVNNNTWGKTSEVSTMSTPNIDVMALARIGASYHFTESMWAGITFQYRLPIAALGFKDDIDSITRAINDDIHYVERKHKGYAIMLTWGIDLDNL